MFFCFQCEVKLADQIVKKMKEDCEARKNDSDAVQDLFDNIELICKEKGYDIEIVIPTEIICPTTTEITTTPTTTPSITTTCIPTNPCIIFVDPPAGLIEVSVSIKCPAIQC
jgi:hypothetical protein